MATARHTDSTGAAEAMDELGGATLPRPGARLARRPLHVVLVTDTSGSMAADGKLQALNTAVREAVPHLVDAAATNPHAQVLVRALRFATGASWHVEEPTPVERFTWDDLTDAAGYTELGAALDVLATQLTSPPMEERALAPALVLISDGMPTDDHERALARLLALPWGRAAVRMAIGVGRDADPAALRAFIADSSVEPISAHNPEQLVRALRWATVHATRAASQAVPLPPSVPVPLAEGDLDELVWG